MNGVRNRALGAGPTGCVVARLGLVVMVGDIAVGVTAVVVVVEVGVV